MLGSTNQVNTLDSTANNFKIALVQLEAGSVATPFETRSVGQELALCQRYYHRIFPGAVSKVLATSGYNTSTSTHVSLYHLPATMRTPPSLEQTGTANNYAVAAGGAVTQCTGIPTVGAAISVNVGVLTASTGATMTNGHGGVLLTDPTNGAAAYIGWSAEL